MKPLLIPKPWWKAWRKFHWEPDTWGVALPAQVVDQLIDEDEPELYLLIGPNREPYFVNPIQVKAYTVNYNTVYYSEDLRKFYVVPQTFLSTPRRHKSAPRPS